MLEKEALTFGRVCGRYLPDTNVDHRHPPGFLGPHICVFECFVMMYGGSLSACCEGVCSVKIMPLALSAFSQMKTNG
jgi:hypothetical protein